MSNVDRHNGFRPYEEAVRCRPYVAGGAVYPGDAVSLNSSGQIVAASASSALAGVAASYASASGVEVMVWDDPDQIFEVQDDGSATLASTGVGLNYNIVANSGNSSYIRSRMELAANSGATTATLPLKLLGFGREQNSDTVSPYQKCVVEINNHQLKGGTGTAGV